MATDTLESPPPSLEERYGAATASSNLRLDENRPGAVNLLIAAGVAGRASAKDGGKVKASRVLGGAIERLMSEWHQVAKPQRMPVLSFKDWMEALPLIQDGGRSDKDGRAVMIRDREGARKSRAEQQKASDHTYNKELMLLAQKLPTRYEVRRLLFAVAVQWDCDEPEDVVAGAIAYWLASKCKTCSGTGEVQAGDKVRTCGDCQGGMEAPVPGADAGRALVNYMDLCRVSWLGAFKMAYRGINGR